MTQTGWTLKGITDGRGACDHCGRTLSRLFRIADPSGQVIVVGRTCSAKLTGFSWTVAQAEHLERLARGEAAAERDYGQLYLDLKAVAARTAERYGVTGAAGDALQVLRDRLLGSDTERTAFARRALAAAETGLAQPQAWGWEG